jgi:hypothetical protein
LRSDFVNNYAYHSRNLWLSYGLAMWFAFIANLLGAYAFWKNGVSHSKSFSAILTATRDKSLTSLFDNEIIGRLPLSQKVRHAKLRFGELRERTSMRTRRSAYGFIAVPDPPLWFNVPKKEKEDI